MATIGFYLRLACCVTIFGIYLNCQGVSGFSLHWNRNSQSSQQANHLLHLVDSEPLFLTPLIEANKIDEARKLSEVHNLVVNLTSYSGFLTVDKQYDSNMFFWFFPALSGKADAPILLWLQGGPGGSSLFGLFVENGPLVIEPNGKLSSSLRKHTWNEDFAMLYIDNPVGTGFSFTKNNAGYSTNEKEVAENLYKALEQFFTVFHEYQKNPFFLTGESYAGKYIPAIAYKIYKMGQQARSKMNLQGLAIGDGLCDPASMFDYGDYLYQIGLLDEIQRRHFKEEQKKAIEFIREKEFFKAFQVFDRLLNGDLIKTKSYFYNVTGLNFYFNFLYDTTPEEFDYYYKFLSSPATRQSIHVGNLTYSDPANTVEKFLLNDIMDSVKPWIEELLNANFRILFYSGQLDIIVAAPLSESFLRTLHWNGRNKYLTAQRYIYYAEPETKTVSGYVRQADNMYYVLIRNAGHILPYDQPVVAQDMIRRFIRKESFV